MSTGECEEILHLRVRNKLLAAGILIAIGITALDAEASVEALAGAR